MSLEEGEAMDHDDILSAIRDYGQSDFFWQQTRFYIPYLVWLLKLGVIPGIGDILFTSTRLELSIAAC